MLGEKQQPWILDQGTLSGTDPFLLTLLYQGKDTFIEYI